MWVQRGLAIVTQLLNCTIAAASYRTRIANISNIHGVYMELSEAYMELIWTSSPEPLRPTHLPLGCRQAL
jgi:hypothetical protein